MYTTYHLNSAQDITLDLIESIKVAFKSKPITITIEEEMDTTSYLKSNPINKKIIEKSIQQAENKEFFKVDFKNL